MSNIVNLSQRRPPIVYTVHVTHHWDDSLEVRVQDVSDDARSKASVADSLRRAADMLQPVAPVPTMPSMEGAKFEIMEGNKAFYSVEANGQKLKITVEVVE
jgi:hypothetical protein